LTLSQRNSKYKSGVVKHLPAAQNLSGGSYGRGPECESDLDVEEEELDEGEILSCTECGTDFEVVGVEPLELAKVTEDEEVEEKELDEDESY